MIPTRFRTAQKLSFRVIPSRVSELPGSRVSGMIDFREEGACREEIALYRGANCLRLKQQELGTPVEEICRKRGIAQATFFNWKKRFSGLGPSELRRLRQLEEENTRLKKLVADLSLDKI